MTETAIDRALKVTEYFDKQLWQFISIDEWLKGQKEQPVESSEPSPLDSEVRAVLAVLLQHAHAITSGGDVHRELKARVLGQARTELVRDRSFSDVTETLFDTAFDLGRAYESWQRSLPVAEGATE